MQCSLLLGFSNEVQGSVGPYTCPNELCNHGATALGSLTQDPLVSGLTGRGIPSKLSEDSALRSVKCRRQTQSKRLVEDPTLEPRSPVQGYTMSILALLMLFPYRIVEKLEVSLRVGPPDMAFFLKKVQVLLILSY